MTQARDVADGKFTNNVLTVSSADNIVGSFESTDAVQWIAMQDSDTSSSTHVMLGAIGDDLRFRAGNNEVGRWLSGGGLAFNGDTAQANALDDYEEGTFTPSIVTLSSSVTYSSQNGVYTKVGRAVHFNLQININVVTSNGSGTFYIGGLPFTQGTNDNFARFVIQTSGVDWNASYRFYAYPSGGTSLSILGMTDNSGWHVFTVSDFSLANSDIITVTGTYFT